MKKLIRTHAGLAAVGILMVGCASGGAPAASPEPAMPVVAQPLPGENFVIYYTDGMGLRRRDTRVGSEAVIVPRSPAVSTGNATFGTGVAVFNQQSTDSTWLQLVGDDIDGPVTLHGARAGRYTFAWSGDRSRLAFAFEPTSANGGAGGVWIVSPDGAVRSVGCSASNRVHAWRPNGQLIVSNTRNVYTVNSSTCATIATLPRQGKDNFAFAANGGMLSFSRGPELYIANHDGSGSQKIADPQVAARDASWAPDASKVAFVINSPRYTNRTHVAVHDVAARRVSFNDRESPMGVPNESNPCWSPDSRRLLFDRVFDRSDGVQTYQTHQKVVKRGNTESVIFEELVRDGRRLTDTGCTWVDNNHVLVVGNAGHLVINVNDRSDYVIGDAESVLMVRVYE